MQYGRNHFGTQPGAIEPTPPVFERRADRDDVASCVRRFDRADLLPAQVSAEGFLHVEGFVARPGVYVYRNADGSTRRELVPAATLHDPASLATLARKPVTLDHAVGPDGWIFVDPSNVQALQVGDVDGLDSFEVADDGRVIVGMVIRRRDAIDAIRSGTHELSPQYDARVDATPGVDPVFGPYDAIQTWREYNAVAVVPLARGGRNLFLRADSADAAYDTPDTGANMDPEEKPATAPAETPKPDAAPAETPKTKPGPWCDMCAKIADAVGMPDAAPDDVLSKIVGMMPAPEIEIEAEAEPEADAAPDLEEKPAAAPEAKPEAPLEPKADAADFERRAIVYATERGDLVDLAKRLDVDFVGVGNAALRKAIAIKARPGARADAVDEYYRGIVDVVGATAGDPMSGLRFDGKAPAKRADADSGPTEPAIARHAREAFESSAPKP